MASRTTSLPRNENERLETPPEIRTPGQRSLMIRVASMNALAYPLCSSIPVAMARMQGSKMMSWGSRPASSVRSRYARSQIWTLRSTVSAWPFSSKAITTPPAPYPRGAGAFLQADGVHDPLALHALQASLDHRPFRAVDHHRHASDLGLGGHEVQEPRHGLLGVQQVGVHVHVDQVRAASDLFQRHLHTALEVACV